MSRTRPGDVVDDTFVRLPPAEVRRATAHRWVGWLDGLELDAAEDRGAEGVRWRRRGGGSAEVWLEPWREGTVVHLYVREPVDLVADGAAGNRRVRRLHDRVRRAWKRGLHTWQDEAEGRARREREP